MNAGVVRMRAGTKGILATLVALGGLFQIQEVHDALIAFAQGHPHILGLIATATTIATLLHNPEVQECLGVNHAPAAKESFMSVETKLADFGGAIKAMFQKLSVDYQKAKQAWTLISSPQTRAVLVQLGSDAVKAVKDGGTAVTDGGFNFVVDAAVVADIKQILVDAKTDGVLAADLKAIGVAL